MPHFSQNPTLLGTGRYALVISNNSTIRLANPRLRARVCVQIRIARLTSFTQKQGSRFLPTLQNRGSRSKPILTPLGGFVAHNPNKFPMIYASKIIFRFSINPLPSLLNSSIIAQNSSLVSICIKLTSLYLFIADVIPYHSENKNNNLLYFLFFN